MGKTKGRNGVFVLLGADNDHLTATWNLEKKNSPTGRKGH